VNKHNIFIGAEKEIFITAPNAIRERVSCDAVADFFKPQTLVRLL